MIFWTADPPEPPAPDVVDLRKDVNGTDQLPPEAQPFEHDRHPRHRESGQFVAHGDVHQAMQRIHDGRQGRATLPTPGVPGHPNQ